MYCGKITMPKSQNPCLESGIYLAFVLLIEGGIESIKRLVQVTNLNPRIFRETNDISFEDITCRDLGIKDISVKKVKSFCNYSA